MSYNKRAFMFILKGYVIFTIGIVAGYFWDEFKKSKNPIGRGYSEEAQAYANQFVLQKINNGEYSEYVREGYITEEASWRMYEDYQFALVTYDIEREL